MNNYKMSYGGFIQKSEMNEREQKSYSKAVMKGISIEGDGIAFGIYNQYLAINIAKSFADIGYDTKIVTIGGGEKYVVWVKKTYADGGTTDVGGTFEFGDGGGIGYIPMEVEEKLALLSKWGGVNISELIGILNAMIDSDVTDNDLQINPTKNTRFQKEKAIEKKIKEIWEKIEPQYKGDLKGYRYYSSLKELIGRNWIYENLLKDFKPFRKYQKFAEGGEIDIEDLPTEVQEVLEKYQYEEEDYHTMLRMSKELNDLGYTFDFGLDAIPTNFRKMKKGGQVGEIKDAIDILESLGDDIDDNVKQALDMLKIVYDEMELPEQPKSIEDIIGENAYKKGGRMKFRDKVDAIADRLEGTKVPKRLRKDYGVTFNREEAEMSGRRIVGSMVKKYGK